ncbi:MAG TPA: DUF2071 domain-containing protein [Thermoanaerobaculia bacterium]|jgi:hypothetical protein
MPRIQGVIRRRLLVNFRVDPEVMQRALPARFRPKLQAGYAVAGICLIRLEEIRPAGFPRLIGVSSENAAHRVAVTWDGGEGVFIPRRDTGSLLNRLAGGRLFPGEHHGATFDVTESGNRIQLRMASTDGKVRVEVDGRTGGALSSSIFPSLEDASTFFQGGSLGYSATASGDRLDGVHLKTREWSLEPLAIDHVYSSYFAALPPGSAELDCALLMRNIAHEWEAAEDMYVDGKARGQR